MFHSTVNLIRGSILDLGNFDLGNFILDDDIEYHDYNGNPEFEKFVSDYQIRKILIKTESLPGLNLDTISRIRIDENEIIRDHYQEFNKYNSRRKFVQFLVKVDNDNIDMITLNYFK